MKFWTIDEILEEEMKAPGFAERLERASQEIEVEFAAERAAIGKHTRTVRPAFSMSRAKQRLRRPATIVVRPAVEA